MHTRNLRGLCGARSLSLAAYLCMAAAVVACDESFDPIAPSELAFSVFGYLDASADTQWVRVMPIRPLAVTSEEVLGVTVTLEHLGTGRIIELRDSLFSFSSYDVHNFWTVEDIEPGTAYRFSVRQEGEEPVEVVVEIPHDFEAEVAINQVRTRFSTDELHITGVKHLPFFSTATEFYDLCEPMMSRIRHAGHSADDETHVIEVTKPSVTRSGCGPPWVANRKLWIVASEAAWPTGGYSPPALGESGWTSNVTNAVGFLGGILSKVVPYEDCEFQSQGAPVPQYCVLRYTQETATVTGTVSETLCGDGPIDSAKVQLTEIDRDPARIRTVLTNRAGEFLFGALEPGVPHFLWVRAPPIPVDSVWDLRAWRYVYVAWEDIHNLPTDTLTFVPGQQVEYDINLQRLTPCYQPPPGAQ